MHLFILGFLTLVSSHGIITMPYPRAIGPASLAACGTQITAIIKADNTSHIEGLPEAGAKDPTFHPEKCNLWLCKGLQFTDVAAKNINAYAPGQVVNFKIWLRVNHKGPANVSIVDTGTNKVIGSPLVSWPTYADDTVKVLPANNTDFNITIPKDLRGQCAVGGACVSAILVRYLID
jgi:hypothetical protein